MDFGIVGLDYLGTSASNNGSFSLENANKQKWHGSGFLNTINEDNDGDLRDFKMAKISLQRSNSSEGQQQMLSFSSPNSQTVASPYYYQTSNAFSRNSGISGYGSSSVRGPFTPSQWMELEHQALIYKYITANVPIPSYLLNPITKALESAGFSTSFSGLRSNPLGWGGFHLGFSNTDPEPGRCRRTDGKKWRCSRDAVADQKYCERHINRGRHRSRKPVEGQPNNANPKPTHPSLVPAGSNSGTPNINRAFEQTTTTLTMASPKVSSSLKDDHHNPYEESEFGLVYSHALLNPLNPNTQDDQIKSQNALRQFIDEWPKDQPTNEKLTSSPIRLSRELEMGLGVGTIDSEQQSKWVPMGGPLGEVLHNTSECSNAKGLNLMASSPTEVLQRGGFGSLSNSSGGSSPSKTLDGISGLVAYGLVSPTIESFSKF